jgi:hypothetical protein
MRNVFLRAAIAAIAFLVTVDTPARPEAAFQADFEPATQTDMHLGLSTPDAPGAQVSVL